MFPKSLGINLLYPSGKEPKERVWKGKAKLGSGPTFCLNTFGQTRTDLPDSQAQSFPLVRAPTLAAH